MRSLIFDLCILAFVAALLTACGGKSGGTTTTNAEMKTNLGVNFTTVKGFVLAAAAARESHAPMAWLSASFAAETTKELFSLNADGTLTKITIADTGDNARVLGTISAGGTTPTFTEQSFGGDVAQIQRIN